MKKLLIIVCLLILYVTGCSNSKISTISIDELNSKLIAKESFVLYFPSDNSSKLEEKLEKILDNYEFSAYALNTAKLSDEEKTNLQIKIPYNEPSIVFIINGEDPTKLSHINNEDIQINEIINRLKDMNFIKETK